MDVSIVIVNWNSTEFTRQCLASILANGDGYQYEVIVVDNASREDCCDILAREFPSAHFVRSEHNIGFARANNLGVEHARGNKILFLNPDTLVRDDAIQRMVKALDGDSALGVIGCTLLNADLSIQMTSIQPFPTVMNQVLGIGWLQSRWPTFSLFGIRELYVQGPNAVAEVDVISGACLMVRRDVLEKVGRFSTDYFMYGEEADLCYKVRQAGWKIGYLRKARIVHFGGQSTNKRTDGFADLVMRESLFKFFKKFRGMPYALLYRLALLPGAVGRLLLTMPMLLIPVRRDDAVRVIRKWGRITAWSLALQNSGVSSK